MQRPGTCILPVPVPSLLHSRCMACPRPDGDAAGHRHRRHHLLPHAGIRPAHHTRRAGGKETCVPRRRTRGRGRLRTRPQPPVRPRRQQGDRTGRGIRCTMCFDLHLRHAHGCGMICRLPAWRAGTACTRSTTAAIARRHALGNRRPERHLTQKWRLGPRARDRQARTRVQAGALRRPPFAARLQPPHCARPADGERPGLKLRGDARRATDSA